MYVVIHIYVRVSHVLDENRSKTTGYSRIEPKTIASSFRIHFRWSNTTQWPNILQLISYRQSARHTPQHVHDSRSLGNPKHTRISLRVGRKLSTSGSTYSNPYLNYLILYKWFHGNPCYYKMTKRVGPYRGHEARPVKAWPKHDVSVLQLAMAIVLIGPAQTCHASNGHVCLSTSRSQLAESKNRSLVLPLLAPVFSSAATVTGRNPAASSQFAGLLSKKKILQADPPRDHGLDHARLNTHEMKR
jgi:hypothetical protein